MTMAPHASHETTRPSAGDALLHGIAVRESLRAESASIDRLQLALGESLETFGRFVWPSVRLVATETVGLPPGVPRAGAGSALAVVLVAAARSAYHARRAMFDPDVEESERDRSERRYRIATVRHALFCELPEVLLTYRVRDPRHDEAWAPEAEALADCVRRWGTRGQIVEAAADDPVRDPWVHARILARLERRRDLFEHGSGIAVRAGMHALPGPADRGWPVVSECARRGWLGLASATNAPDPVADGVYAVTTASTRAAGLSAVRDDIVAAALRLRARGVWHPNTPTGRVWVGRTGIFLLWPLAGRDLCAEVPRVGQTEASMLSSLAAAGLVELDRNTPPASAALWQVTVPRRHRSFRAVRWTGPVAPLVSEIQSVADVEVRRWAAPSSDDGASQ